MPVHVVHKTRERKLLRNHGEQGMYILCTTLHGNLPTYHFKCTWFKVMKHHL